VQALCTPHTFLQYISSSAHLTPSYSKVQALHISQLPTAQCKLGTYHTFLQHITCSAHLTPSYSTVQALHISHLPTAQYILCTSHIFLDLIALVQYVGQYKLQVLSSELCSFLRELFHFQITRHGPVLPPPQHIGKQVSWTATSTSSLQFQLAVILLCKTEAFTAADTRDWPRQFTAAVNAVETASLCATMLHVTYNSTSSSQDASAYTHNSTHWQSRVNSSLWGLVWWRLSLYDQQQLTLKMATEVAVVQDSRLRIHMCCVMGWELYFWVFQGTLVCSRSCPRTATWTASPVREFWPNSSPTWTGQTPNLQQAKETSHSLSNRAQEASLNNPIKSQLTHSHPPTAIPPHLPSCITTCQSQPLHQTPHTADHNHPLSALPPSSATSVYYTLSFCMVILLGLYPEKKKDLARGQELHTQWHSANLENVNNIQGPWNNGLLLQFDASDLSFWLL